MAQAIPLTLMNEVSPSIRADDPPAPPSKWRLAWAWISQHLLARLIMGILVFIGGYWIRNDISKRLLMVEVRLHTIEDHLKIDKNKPRFAGASLIAPRKNLPRP